MANGKWNIEPSTNQRSTNGNNREHRTESHPVERDSVTKLEIQTIASQDEKSEVDKASGLVSNKVSRNISNNHDKCNQRTCAKKNSSPEIQKVPQEICHKDDASKNVQSTLQWQS